MEVVVLAGGYSSRAQAFKMTLEIEGMSVLERTLKAFEGICHKAIIVSGFGHDKITTLVDEINRNKACAMTLQIVYNNNFHQGMLSSIKQGVASVKGDECLIIPGDCLYIKKETVRAITLVDHQVVIPSYQKRGGHPIKVKRNVMQAILKEEIESNLRTVLSRFEKVYLDVTDPGVRIDLDTPEDIEQVKILIQDEGNHDEHSLHSK